MTHIRGLITLLETTREPPSRVSGPRDEGSAVSDLRI